MPSKTKTATGTATNGRARNVKATKNARPFPLNKGEIEILEREAGAYHLLVEAILQNKRLKWEIVHRVLDDEGVYMTPRAKEDAEFERKYPEFAAKTKKVKVELAAAAARIRARELYLMGLVR